MPAAESRTPTAPAAAGAAAPQLSPYTADMAGPVRYAADEDAGYHAGHHAGYPVSRPRGPTLPRASLNRYGLSEDYGANVFQENKAGKEDGNIRKSVPRDLEQYWEHETTPTDRIQLHIYKPLKLTCSTSPVDSHIPLNIPQITDSPPATAAASVASPIGRVPTDIQTRNMRAYYRILPQPLPYDSGEIALSGDAQSDTQLFPTNWSSSLAVDAKVDPDDPESSLTVRFPEIPNHSPTIPPKCYYFNRTMLNALAYFL